MTKRETRVLSLPTLLVGVLMSTGCFTPPEVAAQIAAGAHGEEHGEGEHAQAEHTAEPEGEHGEATHAEEAPHADDGTPEGIQAGTIGQGKKLDVKVPTITYDAPFDGKALSNKTMDGGVLVETFVVGDGAPLNDAVVEFTFKGYGSATAQQIMGSRAGPSKLVVNDEPQSDPIAEALISVLREQKAGAKIRVTIPSSVFETDDAPPQMLSIGDLIMTLDVLSAKPMVKLEGVEAYAGDPIATTKRDDGLEIYDYAPGDGPEAKQGDQVVTHYIGQLAADGTEFDSSHGRPDGLTGVAGGPGLIKGFADGLVGARAGMLRKLVIPPEIGYGAADRGKIPPNSTLVFYLQITEVRDGTKPAVNISPDGKIKDASKPKQDPAKPE